MNIKLRSVLLYRPTSDSIIVATKPDQRKPPYYWPIGGTITIPFESYSVDDRRTYALDNPHLVSDFFWQVARRQKPTLLETATANIADHLHGLGVRVSNDQFEQSHVGVYVGGTSLNNMIAQLYFVFTPQFTSLNLRELHQAHANGKIVALPLKDLEALAHRGKAVLEQTQLVARNGGLAESTIDWPNDYTQIVTLLSDVAFKHLFSRRPAA